MTSLLLRGVKISIGLRSAELEGCTLPGIMRSSPSWRASEAYRNIMKKRMDSVDARAVVVEGMEMDDSE